MKKNVSGWEDVCEAEGGGGRGGGRGNRWSITDVQKACGHAVESKVMMLLCS